MFNKIAGVFVAGMILCPVFAFNEAEFTSAKVIGMGGAYTAIANDENALFYNPAGLSFIDSGMLGHSNLEASMMNDEGARKIDQTIATYSSGNQTVNWNNTALQSALNGQSMHLYMAGGASYFTSGFSLGAHTARDMFIRYSSAGQTVNGFGKNILSWGLSGRVVENLAIGVTIKAISVEAFNLTSTWSTLAADSARPTELDDNKTKTGRMLALNVGLMGKLGDFSLGASVENAFATDVSWEDKNGKPVTQNKSTYQNVIIPVPRIGIGFSSAENTLLACDVARLDNPDQTTFHFGIQQKLADIPFVEWLGGVTVRAGYVTGKQEKLDVTSQVIGASFRFLIAKMNMNMITKKIGSGSPLNEFSASGQITF